MQNPVIFLDFDGVLNQLGRNYGGHDPLKYVDAVCVGRLDKLVQATNAKIVISSSWRRYFELRTLQNILQYKGLSDPSTVIDKTGGTDDKPRGDEIQDWRHAAKHTGPYVVLDDLPESEFEAVEGHFIRTSGKLGLTDVDVARAVEILTLP